MIFEKHYLRLTHAPTIGVLLLMCGLVVGCANSAAKQQEQDHSRNSFIEKVNLERTQLAPAEDRMLNLSVQNFDVRVAEALSQTNSQVAIGDWIFAEILEIESQYLPTVLRNTLVASNQWGAVRVLPKDDLSADVQIAGTLVDSDGTFLEISIQVHDSTGREWLNKRYYQTYAELDEPDSIKRGSLNQEPFQNLYNQIANDLLAVKDTLTESEIKNIKRVAEIRHASDLSPETFAGLLETDESGYLKVSRLLADNDPMLARVARMQLRHHIFIDTLDEYYVELNMEMQPIYDLWRYYSREQILEIEAGEQRARQDRTSSSRFISISNNYRRYTSNKIFEQEWIELAEGFTNELEPIVVELNNQVYGLTGSVEDQYVEWRKILKQFYMLDRQGHLPN